MKKIDAIIRNAKLHQTKEVLDEIGIKGMTVSDVKGLGAQKGTHSSGGRPGSFKGTELIGKTKIEIVCNNEMVDKVISAISSTKTGEIGDGKIFVHSLDDVVRVRTGERGENAI